MPFSSYKGVLLQRSRKDASVVECWWIPLVNTLDLHHNLHLIGPRSTLDQHSVNNQPSVDCQPRCHSTVNPGVDGMSVKGIHLHSTMDVLLSQCFCPFSDVNGHWHIVRSTWQNMWEWPAMLHLGWSNIASKGSSNVPVTIVIVFICQLCCAISVSYQGSRISSLCALGLDESKECVL